MNINSNSFANLIPGGELLSEVPQAISEIPKAISNAIQGLEGGSSHAERCGKFFGAVADRIQQLQQGGTLTAQDVAGFHQAIAYGDGHPLPGVDLTKLDLKEGTNPFLRRGGDDDDGYRCGGNDHDADDRGIDWIHPRQDPDRLEDDRERLGKDERRLNRDRDRCEDDLERIGDDLEDGNWQALGGDLQRYGKDLQHCGRDMQRYDRDVQRYERDLKSEFPFHPDNEDDDDGPQTLQGLAKQLQSVFPTDPDFLQDSAEMMSRLKLR
jgi:hypothetical protein